MMKKSVQKPLIIGLSETDKAVSTNFDKDKEKYIIVSKAETSIINIRNV